ELITQKKAQYTNEEKRLDVKNSKALITVFNGVDMEQFKVISLCETTKEAWTIPLNQHEGNVV
ncbi:hypothetical protein J1N35_037473, partial [Gossypium stocksii]